MTVISIVRVLAINSTFDILNFEPLETRIIHSHSGNTNDIKITPMTPSNTNDCKYELLTNMSDKPIKRLLNTQKLT